MAELLVFDPALCCPTGVCGPEVDPTMVRFAADLEWLGKQGVAVRRFNLAQEPTAFARNPLVRGTLQQEGTDCLPLVMVGGEIVSRGRYPARDELAGWSGVGDVTVPSGGATRENAAPASASGDAFCGPTPVGLGRPGSMRGFASGCC